MIDIDALEDKTLSDILNNTNFDETTPEGQEEIMADLRNSSDRELMDKFLNWNGIIGYTDTIIDALDDIRAASDQGSVAMDILDKTWDILMALDPPGMNSVYAQVLAQTGRQEELLKYLTEYLNGISKTE